MRILVYSDNHFCEKCSIVSGYGEKYTARLENQIESINWVENLAYEKGCQYIICAGDFFDKPQLTDQELTALREIEWAPAAHYFLVGNHESEENDLHFNSTKALEGKNRFVISKPVLFEEPGFELAFLPYMTESDRRPLDEYFSLVGKTPRIMISHNDLIGVQMGPVVSTIGFDPKEIGKYCTFCVNGHLHNGQVVDSQVLNLGNLTGKDFGENAARYPHRVMIIDTDTLKFEFIENPYAFNFYKFDVLTEKDLKQFNNLKNRAVLSVKCTASLMPQVKAAFEANKNKIIGSKLIVVRTADDSTTELDATDLSLDYFAKFYEICHEKIENTKVLDEELAEVLK